MLIGNIRFPISTVRPVTMRHKQEISDNSRSDKKEIKMLKNQRSQVFVFGIVAILGFSLATPAANAALDIERIYMFYSEDCVDGTPHINPWVFGARIDFADTDSLASIEMTLPDGVTTYSLDNENGIWEYWSWPTEYPTLSALRTDYPEGIYTFYLRDGSGSLLTSVQMDFSGLVEAGSPVDFTYPSDSDQTGISTLPTFTWTVDSGAGDVMVIALEEYSATHVPTLDPIFVPMDTLSWRLGPLKPEQNYRFSVDIARIKDWKAGRGFPTMTVDGDKFEYSLDIGNHNDMMFRTGPLTEVGAIVDITDAITPQTKWITCYLTLEGYDVADIDIDSIRLEGDIPADRASIRENQQTVVLRFSGSELNLAPSPQPYLLTVNGQLIDGSTFAGSDYVTVAEKGGGPK